MITNLLENFILVQKIRLICTLNGTYCKVEDGIYDSGFVLAFPIKEKPFTWIVDYPLSSDCRKKTYIEIYDVKCVRKDEPEDEDITSEDFPLSLYTNKERDRLFLVLNDSYCLVGGDYIDIKDITDIETEKVLDFGVVVSDFSLSLKIRIKRY